jgi:hypothetical protein
MKLLFGAIIICLFVSCGKYEKPFISFKSPEKRLTGTTWRCIKAVDEAGNEFEVFDHLNFSIDGSDSTFTRIGNHGQFVPLPDAALPNWNDMNGDGILDTDTIVGSWTWAYALNGKLNKQVIKQTNPGKTLRIMSLSKKVLVFQDQSVDNTIYHYAPL